MERIGVRIGNQYKSLAPHTVCSACVEALRNWQKGRMKCFSFGIPMLWRKARYYMNVIFDLGFNKKKIGKITNCVSQYSLCYSISSSGIKSLENTISLESEEFNSTPDELDFIPEFR